MVLYDLRNQINHINIFSGADCVIVKSKRRLCGTGAALANAPLVQDKSYFEVKIQTGGVYFYVCIHYHKYNTFDLSFQYVRT